MKTKVISAAEARRREYVDRDKVASTTDEEIARQIAEDPDNAPEWTREDMARARVVRPA